MLCRIKKDYNSFTVNNFTDLEQAKECFPEYEIEVCNDIIDYATYSIYVQSLLYRLPKCYNSKEDFILELSKINSAIANSIEFEDRDMSVGQTASILFYLCDNTLLIYDWYYSDSGEFVVGDFLEEDTW